MGHPADARGLLRAAQRSRQRDGHDRDRSSTEERR